MSSKLLELIATYPRLFRGKPPRIPGYVRLGWHGIVMRLCQGIDSLLSDEQATGFQVDQIKEKFGGLNFYFALRLGHSSDGDELLRLALTEKIRELIKRSEVEASATCEVCGAPGQLHSGGWVLTLCDFHSQLRDEGKELQLWEGVP